MRAADEEKRANIGLTKDLERAEHWVEQEREEIHRAGKEHAQVRIALTAEFGPYNRIVPLPSPRYFFGTILIPSAETCNRGVQTDVTIGRKM